MLENKQLQDIYSLSPMQSGLLFQALYAPESDAYFVQSMFGLHGNVDVAALKLAWQTIIDQHPVLRTGIVWEKIEEPLQYVLESIPVPLVEYDWRNLNEEERENYWSILIENQWITSAIWQIKGGKVEIVASSPGTRWEGDLSEAVDATLSSCTQSLPDDFPDPSKTVFVLQ